MNDADFLHISIADTTRRYRTDILTSIINTQWEEIYRERNRNLYRHPVIERSNDAE